MAGQNPFYVDTVENDGYLQDKENTPRIPLVTENILKSARFLNVMQQFSTKQGRDEFREKKILHFQPAPATQSPLLISYSKAGKAEQ